MAEKALMLSLNMYQTLGLAIVLLLLGMWVKRKIVVLQKYFIPAPVIGGTIFSLIMVVGYATNTFLLEFDGHLKDFFMVVFFTSVGFMASFKTLRKAGVGVVIFLICSIILATLQNVLGVSLAKLFGLNPGIGLAAGSVPLVGGHGTSGAFGPYLENLGVQGAKVVSLAAATYGLIAGCVIGGPIAKRLMEKHKLVCKDEAKTEMSETIEEVVTEKSIFKATCMIGIAMGIGACITPLVKMYFGLTLPVYLLPMLVAAIMRNIVDHKENKTPIGEIGIIGNICLSLFLAMALMSMKLWQLVDLAVPLITILVVQTIFMALFAYFVTFNIMGRDYDACVMSTGQCGFGMGATPNAIANMQAFCDVNGFSTKAFFVIPLVGSLFIDFFNAIIIQTFATVFIG